MYKGIDVSTWQGVIDWEKVKASGIEFAMIRCSFGWGPKQIDKRFEQNYKNAKAVGMPVGAYHYSYATSPDTAKKEAQLCLSVLEGKTFEYPIAFDIEENAVFELGKEKVSEIIKAFCETLENAGYYVCVYSSKYRIENYFTEQIFRRYDLWVAQWHDECTLKQGYGIWQNSDKGTVNGIKGYVDTDISYQDYPKLMKSLGFNGFGKQTTPPKTEKPKTESPKLKIGDKVKLTDDAVIYGTKKRFASFVYKSNLYVREIKGSRIVISTLKTGDITGAVHVKYLTKV